MKPWIRICTAVVGLLGAGTVPGHSQQWPEIQLIEAERVVRVKSSADGEINSVEGSSAENGSFVDQVSSQASGELGSYAEGEAQQNTRISRFSISGTGKAQAFATLGSTDLAKVSAISEVEITVQFTVPVETLFSLTGSFDVSGPGADYSSGGVTLYHGGIFESHSYSPGDPPEAKAFSFPDATPGFTTFAADSLVALNIILYLEPLGGYSLPDVLGEALASFNFKLDLGDRDGDGLLDSWETDGIDFDGVAPPDIDLPILGADPDVKDIFVEVDVMAGVPFDQGALDDVVAAFATAPAWAVDNYDGSSGIQLHVILDGDSPFAAPLTIQANETLPEDFYTIKEEYFGSEVDRNHPNWNEIRAAKLEVFRYCLWADSIETSTHKLGGRAEGIPANDFVVAGGALSQTPEFAGVLREAVAGNFMHELGHTLGLYHGGQQNRPSSRPNYLSVMNYTYTEPMDVVTRDGSNAKEVWRLDYSREAMLTLDENRLREFDGIDGPLSRKIIFNSAGDGEPQRFVIEWANATAVDWNDNNSYETEPYSLDISCFGCAARSYEKLESYTDWDRLRYDLHGLVGSGDRTADGSVEDDPCLDLDTARAILNAEWVDHSATSDQIFADDFELGTNYWSTTVP